MKKILIVGGGKVGEEALKYCRDKNYIAIVVDENPNCLVHSQVDFIETQNSLEILNELTESKSVLCVMNLKDVLDLTQNLNIEYLIPAVPIHLMARFSIDYLQQKRFKVKPAGYLIQIVQKRIEPSLICKYSKKEGIIIASFMPQGQICAPNCTEYMQCPKTKIQKPKPLYDLFKDACIGFPSEILISEQLKPNLGGISKKVLDKFFIFLDSAPNKVIVGTSCMCHGIINAFEIDSQNR